MCTPALKTRKQVLEAILEVRGQNGNKLSWSKVAKHFGVSKPCIWRLVKEPDYYPGKKNSDKLGMVKTAMITTTMDEELPPGTQVGGTHLLCVECGTEFVPNHPRRRRCFLCSPYRGQRSS